jgi:hypothetical protein
MKTYWTENEELINFQKLYDKYVYGNSCLWKMDGSFYMSDWDRYRSFDLFTEYITDLKYNC